MCNTVDQRAHCGIIATPITGQSLGIRSRITQVAMPDQHGPKNSPPHHMHSQDATSPASAPRTSTPATTPAQPTRPSLVPAPQRRPSQPARVAGTGRSESTNGFAAPAAPPKVAIPRLKRDTDGPLSASSKSGGRHRINHACEPCRQRKTKCSGERPVCKHCQDFKISCYYADGKRDRVKK